MEDHAIKKATEKKATAVRKRKVASTSVAREEFSALKRKKIASVVKLLATQEKGHPKCP